MCTRGFGNEMAEAEGTSGGGIGVLAGVDSLLSSSERQFIVNGVEQGVRPDGRDRLAARDIHVQVDVIPHANGSASLRCGGTKVIVGVKAELATPDKAAPKRGRIEVSVKCSSTSSTSFQGRAGEDLSTELSFALNRMLGDGMNPTVYETLCVKEGHQCWNLFVDAVVMDFDGSLLDTISLAAFAALGNTVLPKVMATTAESGEVKIDVADAIEDCEPFDVSLVPIALTLVQVGRKYVVDALAVEEACAAARLTVGVTAAGKVVSTLKSEGRGLQPGQVTHMLKGAVAVGAERIASLKEQLAQLREAATADDMEVEPLIFA